MQKENAKQLCDQDQVSRQLSRPSIPHIPEYYLGTFSETIKKPGHQEQSSNILEVINKVIVGLW